MWYEMREWNATNCFVHLTCASTTSKTWANIHSTIIHIMKGFTAFHILLYTDYFLRWCVQWVFCAWSSVCSDPASPVILPSSIFALENELSICWKQSELNTTTHSRNTPSEKQERLSTSAHPLVWWNPLLILCKLFKWIIINASNFFCISNFTKTLQNK